MSGSSSEGGNGLLSAIAHPAGISPNLLTAYGHGLDIAQKQWANKEWQAKQLAGQAFQNSVNPDGTPNQTELNRNLVAAGPQAALAAQTSSQAGQTLDNETYNTHRKRIDTLSGAMGALTAQFPGGVPLDQVSGAVDRLVANGIATPAEGQQWKSMFGGDPAQNSRIILQKQLGMLDAHAALEASRPKPQQQEMGGYTRTIDVNPITNPTGPGAVGTAAPRTTSPETNAGLVETYVPDPARPGSYLKVYQPRSDLPGASGVPGGGGVPGAAPGGGGPAPSPTNPPRLPGAAAPGAAPGAPARTAAAPLAAPPQGTTESNAADTTSYKAAQGGVVAANNAMQNLQHAYQALRLTNAGKSTETTHAMYSLLAAQGLVPQGLVDDVKNYDLFRKYTERYALDQGASSGTDAGRAMAAASNAGTSISTAANLDVLRNEIGRQRQHIAMVAEHKDPTGVGWGKHSEGFSSATDPRGFSVEMYSPAEIRRMVAGMKDDAERTRFHKSVGIAQRLKLSAMPSGM
jgi:hypothetical protein